MDFARQWEPHTLIHLGDMNDFYSVSDHDRDPRRAHNLMDEIKVTRTLFDEMDDLGAVRKIFCGGNHEKFLDRHIMRHAPALMGVVSYEELLGFKQRKWCHIPYREHGSIGKLHFTHEAGAAGETAVRRMAAATGHNIVFGHTHRLASMYYGTILDERYVSASCGWLGDKKSATYKSDIEKAAWQLGFGTVLMNKRGSFQLNLIPIVDYRIIV